MVWKGTHESKMCKISTMKGENVFKIRAMAFPAVGPDLEYVRLGQHDRVSFRVIVKPGCADCLSLSWTSRYEVSPASLHFPACPSLSAYGRFCTQKACQQQATAFSSWLLALQPLISSHPYEWWWLIMTWLNFTKCMASRLASCGLVLDVTLRTTDHSVGPALHISPPGTHH